MYVQLSQSTPLNFRSALGLGLRSEPRTLILRKPGYFARLNSVILLCFEVGSLLCFANEKRRYGKLQRLNHELRLSVETIVFTTFAFATPLRWKSYQLTFSLFV